MHVHNIQASISIGTEKVLDFVILRLKRGGGGLKPLEARVEVASTLKSNKNEKYS